MSNIIAINNCKNCGNQIETYNYCPNCGAKKITKRITFKNLFKEFIDRFFNLDNSFTRTFTHLFTKPEIVIDGYINGLRKRYINAFGYFAISLPILGLYSFFVQDTLIETLDSLSTTDIEAEANRVIFNSLFKYQTLLNFLSIPILAVISKIVFFNFKKYNFTEHLVIYLYAYSHIVTIVSLLLIPLTLWGFDGKELIFQFPIYLIYLGYVLKRLYNLSIKTLLLKTLLFFLVSGGLYIILSIIFAFIIIATGIIDFKDLQTLSK